MTDTATTTAPEPKPAAPKKPAPSKKALLIKALSTKTGADLDSLSVRFGWQPHTTRAALSGLRKAGYEIERGSAGEGKSARYRIVAAPDTAAD